MLIAGYVMMMFDLTTDHASSECYISLPEQGNIRLDLQFDKPLCEAVTCLLYVEYGNSVRIDQLRTELTEFNNGHCADIVYSKGRVFISLHVSVRHSTCCHSLKRFAILIVKTDPHTAKRMHWLTTHLHPRFILATFTIPMACSHSSLIS